MVVALDVVELKHEPVSSRQKRNGSLQCNSVYGLTTDIVPSLSDQGFEVLLVFVTGIDMPVRIDIRTAFAPSEVPQYDVDSDPMQP